MRLALRAHRPGRHREPRPVLPVRGLSPRSGRAIVLDVWQKREKAGIRAMIELSPVRRADGTSDNFRVDVDRHPDECPRCHCHVEPKFVTAILWSDWGGISSMQAVYRCTREKCGRFFFAGYLSYPRQENLHLRGVGPWVPKEYEFPEPITHLSPRFVEIYNNALTAEHHGLIDLVGMGLRKALEFLVKDYAVSLTPEQEESIRKATLGKVIGELGDKRIKTTAARAAWLGNDESHYTRIWEDKDVED